MTNNTKKTMIQLLILIGSFLFSMGLFYAAYRYDNKYTTHTQQPIGGIFYFDPETDSTTQLINGWMYYKDKLLTPDDFAGKLPVHDGYTFIGQYMGMEMGRKDASPHGSVTYSLMLLLPDTPAYYTLELPEIYSAYRLYVGDQLVASQGNPEKEHYEPEIYSGSVTFEASGATRIILAVSDWSWIYSGLVYPPAFGSPGPVNRLLTQKFAWGMATTSLAFLLGLFQIGLAAVQKSRRTLYSALICIAFSVSVCSPPLHRLMTTGLVPFYNIEVLSRYAIYGIAVLLVNHLYGKRSRLFTSASVFAVAFPALALGVSFAAPVLSLQGMLLFSKAAGIYKIACAVWILYTAFLIGRKEEIRASHLLLLTGACMFASSLVADRIWPDFEPVRFGWFSEIAGLIFVFLISFLMFQESIRVYKERFVLKHEKEQMQAQLQLQKNHYESQFGRMQEIRSMKHNVHHHYRQLNLLLENGNYEEMKTYLNQISPDTSAMAPLSFSANYIADVLLRYYYGKAQEANIPFTIHAELPEKIGMPDDDFTVILGNILENALEASLRLPEGRRSMSLTIMLHSADNFLIECRNAFNGELKKKDGKYSSAKEKDRIGFGISTIQAIAEKYDGNAWIDTERSMEGFLFTIRVLLITNP